MLTKEVEFPVVCTKPGCGHHFQWKTPVDLDEIKISQSPDNTEKVKEAARTGTREAVLEEQVKDLNEQLKAYTDGKESLAHVLGCPNCKKAATEAILADALPAIRTKIIEDATIDEGKSILKRHKIWPPSPIEIIT